MDRGNVLVIGNPEVGRIITINTNYETERGTKNGGN
jgi:hypothetical protein